MGLIQGLKHDPCLLLFSVSICMGVSSPEYRDDRKMSLVNHCFHGVVHFLYRCRQFENR